MQPGTIRTIAIILALAVGAVSPWAAAGARLIPWLVAGMLFVVFLGTPLSTTRFRPTHFYLLAANIAIAGAAYGVGWWFGGRELALAGFFAGIAPTAAAAPVVVGLLGGQVDFVVAAFLLSNTSIAGLLALGLPWLISTTGPSEPFAIARSIAVVVLLPMLLAALTRRVRPAAVAWPKKLGNLSFATWVVALFLNTAKASRFIGSESSGAHATLLPIALLSAGTCAVAFVAGHFIGGRSYAREASQALGQKNTNFTIYLALAHASPLVALGPTFYVLWHNLWNAWNLHRAHRPRAK